MQHFHVHTCYIINTLLGKHYSHIPLLNGRTQSLDTLRIIIINMNSCIMMLLILYAHDREHERHGNEALFMPEEKIFLK